LNDFLKFVDKTIQSRDFKLDGFPLSCAEDDLVGFGAEFEGIGGQDLPMVKDALREGLARSVRSEIGGETEGLIDGKEGLDVLEGTRTTIFFGNDLASSSVEHAIDTTDDASRALDFDEVNGLHDAGFGGQGASINASTSGGDDLTSSSVDGVGVEGHVENLEAATAHVFLAENSFLGRPLEGSDARVLDFIEVLDSLGGIVENVGSGGVGTEAPDLSGLIGVPFVLVGENLGSDLGVILGAD